MSEKRFIVDYEVGVLDTKTNKIICDTVSADEVVDLLNELHEENDVLKQQLKTKYVVNKQYEKKEKLKKCINQLEKENKILHQRIQILREEIQSTRQILKMQIDKLKGY